MWVVNLTYGDWDFTSKIEVKIHRYEVKSRAYEVEIRAYEVRKCAKV